MVDYLINDYSTVTETPGSGASREQVARLFHRYHFAASFCEGRDVLEVGCGAGQGLGYLAKKARRVVGGDYTGKLVQAARDYYNDRLELYQLDAHELPFEDKSFDVVILYEAIYYLARPKKFLREARRVLRYGGTLLIATANKDWTEFNPSPFSTRYFSVPELDRFLKDDGFTVRFYGAFSALPKNSKEKSVASVKKIAVALHLIPKTMRGKEFLKRIFFGKLISLPHEITDGMAEYTPPVPIPHDVPNFEYKVLYAVARLQ